MTFHDVMTSRYTATQARDPDTLHGALIFVEAGGDPAELARLMHLSSAHQILQDARSGSAGRVPAFKGFEHALRPVEDFDEGILPYLWKRDLIGLLLRPDGITTEGLIRFLNQNNRSAEDPGGVIGGLRDELKPFRVKVESSRVDASRQYRYRIAGKHAWRLQKIISNGWSL